MRSYAQKSKHCTTFNNIFPSVVLNSFNCCQESSEENSTADAELALGSLGPCAKFWYGALLPDLNAMQALKLSP